MEKIKEDENYIFIRVPKRFKLSEIINKIQDDYDSTKINAKILIEKIDNSYYIYSWDGVEQTILLIVSEKGRITTISINWCNNVNWLFELAIAGTYIEVDV